MMRGNEIGKALGHIRSAVMIASGIVLASTAHANPSSNVIVIPPTALPALARQSGDAMFLRDAKDGRSILYVEQSQGAELAVFDVTDPGHVKSEGAVTLSASGPYDFVSPLGGQKELIRFRQDRTEAVLDLHKATVPSLEQIPGLNSHGEIALLGSDGFTASQQSQANATFAESRPMRDYQVVDTSNSDPVPVVEVKQVREELSKQDTGTTFLLAEGGLYLIRRPEKESDKKRHDQERFWQYNGG